MKTCVRPILSIAMVLLSLPATAGDSLDERIAQVENGLMPGIVIKGRPASPARIADRMAAMHVPGVSVAVIDKGAIAWARGYGVAEAGSKRAVTTETLFQAASISKPVATLAALRLVEQGKLSLDADINAGTGPWKLPEGAQTAAARVNLRRLLNHSAGTSVHGFRGYAEGESVPTLLELLDGLKPANSDPVRVTLTPGEQWKYSGGGISIVQLAMTNASGNSFAPLMQASVLDPLGMTHSSYAQPLPAALAGNAASGHDRDGAPIKGKWHTYPEQAAAGLWTTPSDLARFAIELQRAYAGKSHKVISPAMARTMLTRMKGDYGLGIHVEEEAGQIGFSHGGSNEGFRAMLYAFTSKDQGAVVMTNGDRGSDLAGEILRSIAKVYGWKTWNVVEKEVASVDAPTLNAYAGHYQLDEVQFDVTQEKDRLFISAPPFGTERHELFPLSATRFFMLDQKFEFAFEKEADGKFNMVLHADEPHKAKRLP